MQGIFYREQREGCGVKMHRSKMKWKIFNLKNNFLLLTFLVIVVSLLVSDFLISDKIGSLAYDNLEIKVSEIANITAHAPVVRDTLAEGKPEDQKDLEAFTEKILETSGVRFITVLDMQRIRKTHPNPHLRGTYYENHDADDAFAGNHKISVDTGPLGTSLRAFAPVYNEQGVQIGVVLAGVMLDAVDLTVIKAREHLLIGSFCGLLVGILGAFFLARRIKESTFGLEPFVVARLLEERNAILTSIREGAIAIDRDENITIVNTAAMQLFQKSKMKEELIGQKVDAVVPNSRMQNVLQSGEAELDQEQQLNGRTIVTNRVPVLVDGQLVGVVATFRDKSEMRKLAEKLVDLKIYVDALRAQTHEFMNKLHVVGGLVHLEKYEQLKEYIAQIAHRYQMEIGMVVRGIRDPVLAGFLLGKVSLARESGANLIIAEQSNVREFQDQEMIHDVITIVGNLINNALDAVADTEQKDIVVELVETEGRLHITVRDTGKGFDTNVSNPFTNTYSTKGEHRGFGLYITKASVDRWGGDIQVESEYGKGTVFFVSLPCKTEDGFFD